MTRIVWQPLHLVGVDHILIDLILAEVLQLVRVQAGEVLALPLHGEDHGAGLEIKRIPVHAVIAKEPNVVESAESDLILLPRVELSVLHI